MGVKRILAAYEKQYEKSISQTAAQREAKDKVWVDMATNLRKRGRDYRKELLAEHTALEDEWLRKNIGKSSDSPEFKRLANIHIAERNSFAVPYGLAPEPELK